VATPTPDSLRNYLGDISVAWTDDELLSVINSELSAQEAKCGVDGTTLNPPDLDEALFRRCARNLAMRKMPVGINNGETESIRLSQTDPEITRLEAPYRKWPVG
jgi:hypothetical protein